MASKKESASGGKKNNKATPELSKRPEILLWIETSNAYARGLLEGVMDYVRRNRPWAIRLLEQGRGAPPPAWLPRWKGDGILARIETPEIARAIQGTKLPVVDVSAGRHLPSVPWVETDDAQIARMAAEHFSERGFTRWAFCGDAQFAWSKLRQSYFLEEARKRGVECHLYSGTNRPAKARDSLEQDRSALAHWAAQLPSPCAVFACYDLLALRLLEVIRELGRAVPEDLAVLGVDNDLLLCGLTTPTLSSVRPDTRRTGYEAASLLDRMLAGERIPPNGLLIRPIGIESRLSTDSLAIPDRDVAAALRFIREHACDGIGVMDVLRVVPLSRRMLEHRFRKWSGRTPHEEILRTRIERAKKLLVDTDDALERIAPLAGFEHPEYLSYAFRRETGITPGSYRRLSRMESTQAIR